jgi:predicted DNA-binding protein YlxM (UPF0122 family)
MSKADPARLEAAHAARHRVVEKIGVVELAQALEITRQAVSQWVLVPLHHIEELEKLTGFSRYEMRPDIYGDPPLILRSKTTREAAA